jgi:di- and tripeptidase/Cys-Gly metallodipeptidase DUG1
MAERAVRREWGEPPLYVREGGTMPVASLIEKMLGAPALMIPMGQSSDNCHLANERLRRVNLIKGKNVVSVRGAWRFAAAAAAAAAPVTDETRSRART